MPTTYSLIASNTLSSSAASVTFSSIPNTFTDLVLRASARNDNANALGSLYVKLNNISTNYSDTYLQGTGSAAQSFRSSAQSQWVNFLSNGNNSTSNTFSSFEFYFPNYAGTTAKVGSTFGVQENNATAAYIGAFALLQTATAAIDSITLSNASPNLFLSGSSFFLYGIKNS